MQSNPKKKKALKVEVLPRDSKDEQRSKNSEYVENIQLGVDLDDLDDFQSEHKKSTPKSSHGLDKDGNVVKKNVKSPELSPHLKTKKEIYDELSYYQLIDGYSLNPWLIIVVSVISLFALVLNLSSLLDQVIVQLRSFHQLGSFLALELELIRDWYFVMIMLAALFMPWKRLNPLRVEIKHDKIIVPISMEAKSDNKTMRRSVPWSSIEFFEYMTHAGKAYVELKNHHKSKLGVIDISHQHTLSLKDGLKKALPSRHCLHNLIEFLDVEASDKGVIEVSRLKSHQKKLYASTKGSIEFNGKEKK